MKEVIDIGVVHQCCLRMAIEFDRICRENNIPYYMLGGTMLGAVRHKGFIPWDDDMDFGIPRPFFNKFLSIAFNELQKPYKFLYVNNSDYAVLGIGKISDLSTEIKDDFTIKTKERLGVNIDIFPLDFADSNTNCFSRNWFVRKLFRFQKLLFIAPEQRPFHTKLLALLCQKIFRFRKESIVNYLSNFLSKPVNHPTHYANYFGAWGYKEIVPLEVFGEPKLYSFEKVELYGVNRYDEYLKQLYGDYMKIPPEGRRHTHACRYYKL